MNELKISMAKAVAVKYTEKLQNLMNEVTESNFRSSQWLKKNKTDNHFIVGAVELGYIKPINKIGNRVVFVPCYESNEITVTMGEKLRLYIKEIYANKSAAKFPFIGSDGNMIEINSSMENNKIKSKSLRTKFPVEQPEPQIIEKEVPIRDLSVFTMQEIVDEIKRRGYTGTVERIEEFKF